MKKTNKGIITRLQDLERKLTKDDVIPIVIMEYQDGSTRTYKGTPPNEAFKNAVNAFGSDFAKLICLMLHPVQNRNIEDFE